MVNMFCFNLLRFPVLERPERPSESFFYNKRFFLIPTIISIKNNKIRNNSFCII